MNPLQIILDVASTFASDDLGIGVYFDGQVRFVGGSTSEVCDIARRIATSALKPDVLARLGSVADLEGHHEIDFFFGVRAAGFSLRRVTDTSALAFTVSSTSLSQVSALDHALASTKPRKAKKYLTKIAKSVPEFHRKDDVTGMFNELAIEVKSQYDDWKESAFTSTLASYKDFVSSFCHEALSPIQEIQSTLELAMKDDAIDGLSHQRLESSYRSLEGLRVSLEGMRLLFRDDERKPLANQFRKTNLKSTVDRWLNSYQSQFAEKNIKAIAEPDGRQWSVWCVPEYVEILVRNLISNGVKYSFDAKCFDDGEAGKFLIRFDQSQRKLAFVNFGVPISQDEIESGTLFERDIRGGTANDRGRVGKGVGLYLVKRVVDLHGAKLSVKSQIMNPGGTQQFARNEFEVRFPPERKRPA